ncbi:hypothetical protein EVAR_53403_1 [Eumeta japonica]|uniref:MADF domain-containing protein n=1 Tax=Eumeta variegata TaxID=151549 RepID=A0A4C1XNG8_EUMVA|nr:hypothetical protein EVAR_53403_1 [Eumeta japonica]
MNKHFIDCVREHPCLWDMNAASYKDFETRNAAWREVAKQAKIESVKLAKIKWKNLRDTHREKLKKIADIKLKHPKKKIRPWRYMGQMEFLTPFMLSRDRDNVEYDLVTATRVKQEKEREESKQEPPRKNRLEDSLLELLQTMDERRRSEVEHTGDALRTFFESMYESTKKLPEPLQREVKRKVFNAVMAAEEQSGTYAAYTESPGTTASDSPAHSSGSAPRSPSATRCFDIASVKLETYITSDYPEET